MFIDQVKIRFKAGTGGNGVVAWRREKYIPKGGPAGGNGGDGGSIYLQVDPGYFSLESVRHLRLMKAQNGQAGSGKNQHGRRGEDMIVKLPPGTLIKDAETDQILYDLTNPDEKILLCKGGYGGRGNTTFKTSIHRAPNQATPGREGESVDVILELKMIADIGLVGFPNAGKSTLISQITKANVKIAPYPFTTLRPNLGIIEFEDYTRALIADIPGILPDAHLNKGLGLSFLKHIERTRLLAFVLDMTSEDWVKDFETLRHELQCYDPQMLKKPFLIILNKSDMCEDIEKIDQFKAKYQNDLEKIFVISALKKQGLKNLVHAFHQTMQPIQRQTFLKKPTNLFTLS